MEDTKLKLSTLLSARNSLRTTIVDLDLAGERLLAAQMSTMLDSIESRLRCQVLDSAAG